jgi:hypothetical protein
MDLNSIFEDNADAMMERYGALPSKPTDRLNAVAARLLRRHGGLVEGLGHADTAVDRTAYIEGNKAKSLMNHVHAEPPMSLSDFIIGINRAANNAHREASGIKEFDPRATQEMYPLTFFDEEDEDGDITQEIQAVPDYVMEGPDETITGEFEPVKIANQEEYAPARVARRAMIEGEYEG